MNYTFHDLKSKNVAELRDIAKTLEHEAVQGALQMNKDHLLVAICQVLGIDSREHHVATGIDKTAIKTQINELKQKRDEFMQGQNFKGMKIARRKIHRLKHQLRRAMV